MDGLREQFEEVLTAHERRLLALATSVVRETHAAQDIVQDVFVRLWHRMQDHKIDGTPYAWLRTVTLNCCRDHLRKQSRRNHDDLASVAELLLAPEGNTVEDREQANHLEKCIASLPPLQRQAVVLVFFDGMTSTEAAEALNCKPSTVRTHCQLAREALLRIARGEQSTS